MKVAAGIVLFHPDPAVLAACVKAIAPQVSVIYLYDNGEGSAEGESLSADSPAPIRLLGSGKNVGMARALNAICDAARIDGCDAVSFLDQDSLPSAELVAVLAGHLQPNVGLAAPLVRDRNEREAAPTTGRVFDGRRVITAGSFVNLEAHRAVGGYDEQLFVDWVDFEFCYALILRGFRVLVTHETFIDHQVGEKEFVLRWPRVKSRKVVLWPYYRTNHSLTRIFDSARAQSYIHRKYAKTGLRTQSRRIFLKWLVLGVVLERDRVGFLRSAISGWRDGALVAREGA